MRLTDFLSLTCKLVHAAQYRPAGRPYLTCMFTAMRQATRSGAKRVRLGRGVRRDLRWWQQWLPVPTDGVAFFPLNHFPPSGSVDLLEFAYDASGVEGLGARPRSGDVTRRRRRQRSVLFYRTRMDRRREEVLTWPIEMKLDMQIRAKLLQRTLGGGGNRGLL